MNQRIELIREQVRTHYYDRYRMVTMPELAEDFSRKGLTPMRRSAERFRLLLEAETPVVLKEDRIALVRTVKNIPDIHTRSEWKEISKNHFICESGDVFNICSDYEKVISSGFAALRSEIKAGMKIRAAENNHEGTEFLECALDTIDSLGAFAERYREEAVKCGNTIVAESFSVIPEAPARSYTQALQFFRLINYALWINGNYHNTLGRFDQYMYPYYSADIESGRLSPEEAYELTVETFLSMNRDSTLYKGVQQGDNGQSIVLGGSHADGGSAFNELTRHCLNASLENGLIDPKINLRVSRETNEQWFVEGTRLTKAGLGFPQYSNDDVIIDALIKWGYEPDDARNYVTAACWEFIIPGKGMDIPNIDAVNLPDILNRSIHEDLEKCSKIDELIASFEKHLKTEIDDMVARHRNIYINPSPFQSVCMSSCISEASDISSGGKYRNYGIHGSGISTVVDSLYAIKSKVFSERGYSAGELVEMLDKDYEGFDGQRNELAALGKMGELDPEIEELTERVIDIFSGSLSGIKNERGGIYRAGTGTAMYYIWHSKSLAATADGRKKGQPFPANFSPSLIKRNPGLLSVVKAFSPRNIHLVANGGPLTLELHNTVFRNDDGIEKTAKLVQFFIHHGGHQLQINTLDKEVLLDARNNPADYRNLIVRVWGWSGYFTELDREYQDHIIRRHEYGS